MKKHLSGVPNLSGSLGHSNDAKAASTFLLGLASLNGPTNFYSPSYYAPGPNGISNKSSGYAS